MKNKKEVFRVRDQVIVKNPLFFVRSGYNLDKEQGKKLISDDDKIKICQILGLNYDVIDGENLLYSGNGLANRVFEEIIDRLAYYKIASQNFGGKERRIFTEEKPEYLGKQATVVSKRTVKTGIYNHGFIDYEGDCTPPYLSNEESHVILKLSFWYHDLSCIGDFEIEEVNVEKVKSEKPWVKQVLENVN